MKAKAYGLGVFGFGMVAVGQMTPVLLGDDTMSNWQFAGLTLTVLSAMFCGYKSLGVKAESPSTRVKGNR
ncbi:hypothetical protein [Pseudomonas aeruginosa]|uniref:hypothetical protein n=1 Tax=Pseudomonas aeruginosa TaxID=287 RepID=UPI002A6A7374|nr:hypothetical protein [Pseudomonas aeruginosa]MDY1103252.1 hypothetical protein [Pseudomonas aeruginosa]